MPAVAEAPLAAVFTARLAVVETFDERMGAGTVREEATGTLWAFHCTVIADGSRTIPTGIAVTFRVEPGPTGLEAVAVAAVEGEGRG